MAMVLIRVTCETLQARVQLLQYGNFCFDCAAYAALAG